MYEFGPFNELTETPDEVIAILGETVRQMPIAPPRRTFYEASKPLRLSDGSVIPGGPLPTETRPLRLSQAIPSRTDAEIVAQLNPRRSYYEASELGSPYAPPRGYVGLPKRDEGPGPLVNRRLADERRIPPDIIAPQRQTGMRQNDIGLMAAATTAPVSRAMALASGGLPTGLGGAITNILPTVALSDAIRRTAGEDEPPGELTEIVPNQVYMAKPKSASMFGENPQEWARRELGRTTAQGGPAAQVATQSLAAMDEQDAMKAIENRIAAFEAVNPGLVPFERFQMARLAQRIDPASPARGSGFAPPLGLISQSQPYRWSGPYLDAMKDYTRYTLPVMEARAERQANKDVAQMHFGDFDKKARTRFLNDITIAYAGQGLTGDALKQAVGTAVGVLDAHSRPPSQSVPQPAPATKPVAQPIAETALKVATERPAYAHLEEDPLAKLLAIYDQNPDDFVRRLPEIIAELERRGPNWRDELRRFYRSPGYGPFTTNERLMQNARMLEMMRLLGIAPRVTNAPRMPEPPGLAR